GGKQQQQQQQQDGKDFVGFEGYSYDPSSFYRPPIWTGASNAADGLLGCQAPAADGLELHPAEPTLQELRAASFAEPLPRFPTEIHLQILSHVISSSGNTTCSFCHIFQLSTLSRVSRLYHALLQPYLYSTVNLNFNSSIKSSESLTHHWDDRSACLEHLRLASKRHQLELRVPLLIRTLTSRPDIAATVRRLVLPAGGTQTYLTCTLEKQLLPELVRCCPNLAEVDGVESLLARQFFSGEHYCFDGLEQQHGVLAKTLHETSTLRKWCWNVGNAAGSDFAARVWDQNPAMAGIGFVQAHKNWKALETLEIREVWNLEPEMLRGIVSSLPRLWKVVFVGIRKKRAGHGDSAAIFAALEALSDTVTEVEVGNIDDEAFLPAVGEWLRDRYDQGRPITSVRISQVPITTKNLCAFFAAIAVRERLRFYLPLLTRWGCAVQKLSLDGNLEGEYIYGADEACMELGGLQELGWRVRGGEMGLADGIRRGWFRDLQKLSGVEDEQVALVAREREVALI
ncbi:hypothetical protein FN846DRAFT_932672, partial [Sphaerosporella brunnea]